MTILMCDLLMIKVLRGICKSIVIARNTRLLTKGTKLIVVRG